MVKWVFLGTAAGGNAIYAAMESGRPHHQQVRICSLPTAHTRCANSPCRRDGVGCWQHMRKHLPMMRPAVGVTAVAWFRHQEHRDMLNAHLKDRLIADISTAGTAFTEPHWVKEVGKFDDDVEPKAKQPKLAERAAQETMSGDEVRMGTSPQAVQKDKADEKKQKRKHKDKKEDKKATDSPSHKLR
jgi:hypothetical protein